MTPNENNGIKVTNHKSTRVGVSSPPLRTRSESCVCLSLTYIVPTLLLDVISKEGCFLYSAAV